MTADDSAAAASDEQSEPARRRPTELLARTGNLEYDRVLFFSDAVFAIAITLLVVDLPVPRSDGVSAAHQLHIAIPEMTGFGISFAVIGLFWLGHHVISRYITAFDRRLILLNLLFLGTIAFLPYPTELLSRLSGQTAATIFYASCCAAAGLAEAAFWLYATRTRAAAPSLASLATADIRRACLLRILRAPLIFAISIPVAVAAPTVAMLLWILIWPLDLILRRIAPIGGHAVLDEPGYSQAEPAAPAADQQVDHEQ